MYFMRRGIKIWQNRLPKEPACQKYLLAAGIARVATTGIIVPVAAEAADKKNPDQPFTATAVVSTTEDAVATAIAAAVTAATATEQKQKDNPHTAVITAHKIGTAATAAVAGSQITHIECLQK